MPIDTKILGAIIRQVDSHNKGVEVREMWKQWEKRKEGRSDGSGTDSHSPHRTSSVAAERRAKLREQLDKRRVAKRLLDRDRWGNEGFQSLYESTEGPATPKPPDTALEEKKKKKKKKEKEKENGKEDKTKKRKKEKKSKKKKKKKEKAASETETESDSSSDGNEDGGRDSVKRKRKMERREAVKKRKISGQ